jgi:hypothetical protein
MLNASASEDAAGLFRSFHEPGSRFERFVGALWLSRAYLKNLMRGMGERIFKSVAVGKAIPEPRCTEEGNHSATHRLKIATDICWNAYVKTGWKAACMNWLALGGLNLRPYSKRLQPIGSARTSDTRAEPRCARMKRRRE